MTIDYLVRNGKRSEDSKKKTSYLILPLPNHYFFADIINKKTDQKSSKDYKPIYSGLIAYDPYSSPYGLTKDKLSLNPNKKPEKAIREFNPAYRPNPLLNPVSELEKMTILSYLRPTPGGVKEEQPDRDFKLTILEEKRTNKIYLILFKKDKEKEKNLAEKEEERLKKLTKDHRTEEYKRMVSKYLN